MTSQKPNLFTWLGMLIVFEALFIQMLFRTLDLNFDIFSILLVYIGGLVISK